MIRLKLLTALIMLSLSSLSQTTGKIFKATRLMVKNGKWTSSKIPVPKYSFIKMNGDSVHIQVRDKHTYIMEGLPETTKEQTIHTHVWDCKDDSGKSCKFMMKIMILDKLFIISIIYPSEEVVLEYVTN